MGLRSKSAIAAAAVAALGCTAPAASAFPAATTTLDAFNRSGGALTGSWATAVLPDATGAPVLGNNRIQFPSSGWSSARWTGSTFAGGQEAFITKTSPGNLGVLACVTNPGANATGYALIANGSGSLTLKKYVGTGTPIDLFSNDSSGGTVTTWDSIGIQVTGTKVRAYIREGTTPWVLAKEVTDGAAASCSGSIGVIGMGVSGDNFSGSDAPQDPPPPTGETPTVRPASEFTDSVGMNLAMTSTDAASQYDNFALVEDLLRDARIRHVRTSVKRPSLTEYPGGSLSFDTKTVDTLGRAGVRSILLSGPTLPGLYLDQVDRAERGGTNGWATYFEERLETHVVAQQWLQQNTAYPTRITGLEGINEPNLKYRIPNTSTLTNCVNWMSKTADYQQRMIQRVAGTSLASATQVAPSFAVRSPSACPDAASSDAWRALGRFTAPTGSGFTTAWNAGWMTPSSFVPATPWFSAGTASLASQVAVANLHAYPGRSAPQRLHDDDYWRMTSSGPRVCNTPVLPTDPETEGGPLSCAAHAARLTAAGESKPVYLTETGYMRGGPNAISDSARGVYIPRLLLENLRGGIRRSYLFELLPRTGTTEEYFLLAGPASSTTYGYNALRRLNLAIGDGELPGTGDLSAPLDLTVTEIPGSGSTPSPDYPVRHLLFAERDGSYSLALWPTDQVVNPENGSAMTPPVRKVTLSLGSAKRLTRHPIDPTSTTDIAFGDLISAATTSADIELPGGHAVVIKIS